MNNDVDDVTGLRIGGWIWGLWPVWTTAFCMLPIVWCVEDAWWQRYYVVFLTAMPMVILAGYLWVEHRRKRDWEGGGEGL